MTDRARETARMGPLPETYVQSPRGQRVFWRVVWVVVVTILLGSCLAGLPSRFAELQIAAADEAESVSIGRLLPAEQQALANIGLSMAVYVAHMHTIAMVVVAASVVLAVLIYWRRPDSRITWVVSIYLIIVATTASFNVDGLVRAYPVLSPLLALQGALQFFFSFLLFCFFPNGKFTPRWSRWVVLVWGLFLAVQAMLPDVLGRLGERTAVLSYLLMVPLLIGGTGLQVHRYLRVSTSLERQQTKWVVVVLAVLVVLVVLITTTMQVRTGSIASPLVNVAYETVMFWAYELMTTALLGAFVVAITRYRLWDIDYLINRSLVYGALTTSLAVVFVGSILALRQLMLMLTDGQQLPLVLGVAALVVGLLFAPSRRFLHRTVNRWVYGIGIEVRPRRDHARGGTSATYTTLEELLAVEGMQLIGRGGMASVFRAHDPDLRRDVAIKILRGDLAAESDEYVIRFEREARIIAELCHDNIVRLERFGTLDDGTHFIVMEYIAGKDLHHLIATEGPLDMVRALPLLRDIGAALDHAHGEGIVHRDIKPSNVLLDPVDPAARPSRYRAVVSDFGIAKLASATSMTQANVVGTIEYVSPEQIRDSAQVDARSDIYSVGVLLFQLLTGRRPFDKSSPVALMLAHLRQPPPDARTIDPSIPAHVANALCKAMAKDPADRFLTLAAMVEAVRGEGHDGATDQPDAVV